MPGVELICGCGMGFLAFEICEVLPGGVVIAAFDFAVAAADGGVDRLMGLPIEVAGETVRCLATGTGEAGGFAGVLLKVGRFVHNTGFLEIGNRVLPIYLHLYH